jgi:hypothetical protein
MSDRADTRLLADFLISKMTPPLCALLMPIAQDRHLLEDVLESTFMTVLLQYENRSIRCLSDQTSSDELTAVSGALFNYCKKTAVRGVLNELKRRRATTHLDDS